MPRIRTSVAVAASALLAACGGGDTPAARAFATGTTCPPGGTVLTYANFGLAFFGDAAGTTGYCNYCHDSSKQGVARNGAPEHATFDKIEVIRAHAYEIDQQAGKGPTPTVPAMPFLLTPPLPPGVPDPQPVPTDQEREALSEWLACGAP